MRYVILPLLICLAGCAGADRDRIAEVPRDSRGEPVFAAIAPVPAAAATSPDAAPPGSVPARVESCRHRRRCP